MFCIVRYSREHCECGVLLCAVYVNAGSINSTCGYTRVLHSHYLTFLVWIQPICRRDEAKLSGSGQLGFSSHPTIQGGLLNDYYEFGTMSSVIDWSTR